MAEVLLFHHALGLTPGVLAFADELRAAGHVVHTPDLYEGKTFATVLARVRHALVDPGDKHLFAEPGFADYDEAAAALMKQRVLDFLG